MITEKKQSCLLFYFKPMSAKYPLTRLKKKISQLQQKDLRPLTCIYDPFQFRFFIHVRSTTSTCTM